jgi:hypothetical protein
MNAKQFTSALKLATNRSAYPDLVVNARMDMFAGFGLRSFRPIYVRTTEVAALIRWHASYLSDGFDQNALDEIAQAGRTKLIIVE